MNSLKYFFNNIFINNINNFRIFSFSHIIEQRYLNNYLKTYQTYYGQHFGNVACIIFDKNTGQIFDLYVDRKYRNKKMATQLIEKIKPVIKPNSDKLFWNLDTTSNSISINEIDNMCKKNKHNLNIQKKIYNNHIQYEINI